MNIEQATGYANEFFASPEAAQRLLDDQAVFDFPGAMHLQGRSKIEHVFAKAPDQGIESTTYALSNICLGGDGDVDLIAVEMEAVYRLVRAPAVTVRGLSMLTVKNGKVVNWLYCINNTALTELIGMADQLGSASVRMR